jgi:hypothetical protein
MQQIPGMDDEDYQDAFERLGHQAQLNWSRSESPRDRFYYEVPRALQKLVDATVGAKRDVENELRGALTWEEAATIACRHWYNARIDEGMSHKQIAERLGVTPQAFAKRLKTLGIESRRFAHGKRGGNGPTSLPG